MILWLNAERCEAKSYASDGNPGLSKQSSDDVANSIISPMLISEEQTVCNDDIWYDSYFFNTGTQNISISYVDSFKTLRISFGPAYNKLYLRINGRVATYTLNSIVYRVPPEHTIKGKEYQVEAQQEYTIDNAHSSHPATLVRSILYYETKNATMNTFSSIVTALSSATLDTLRLSSESWPIVISVPHLDSVNLRTRHPINFFAYYNRSSKETRDKNKLSIVQIVDSTVSPEMLQRYKDYLLQLSGKSTNARAVVVPDDLTIYKCGEKCTVSIAHMILIMLLYAAVLYTVHVLA